MKCPFNNYNCLCQYCEKPCNNGETCIECRAERAVVHDIYLCTGFTGDLDAYIRGYIAKGEE